MDTGELDTALGGVDIVVDIQVFKIGSLRVIKILFHYQHLFIIPNVAPVV